MSQVLLSAWQHIKQLEGGFTIDEGGATKFGICWKWDKQYLIPMGYTEATVKNLTATQAYSIFTQKYWFKHRFYLLERLPLVCQHALDLDFHEGKYGWMSVQLLMNEVLAADLSIDGSCGPNTRDKITELIAFAEKGTAKSLNDRSLCALLRRHKINLYKTIWLEDLKANDARATTKYNSALRRV